MAQEKKGDWEQEGNRRGRKQKREKENGESDHAARILQSCLI